MNHEAERLTFVVPEQFHKGLKLVRRTLEEEGLKIHHEMDVSAKLRRELGTGLAQCRVLYVDSPFSTLEAMLADRSAGVFLPLHIVVSGRNGYTLVHLLNPVSIHDSSLAVGAKAPLSRLLTQLVQMMERIGMRKVYSQISA